MINSPLFNGTGGNLEGELAPPLVRGLTNLPEHSWQHIEAYEDGESETDPIQLLSDASALFAKAAKLDPTMLRTMLELGNAIAKTMGGPAAMVSPELFAAPPPAPPMMGPPPTLPMPPPPMGPPPGPPMGPAMGPPMGGLPPPALR